MSKKRKCNNKKEPQEKKTLSRTFRFKHFSVFSPVSTICIFVTCPHYYIIQDLVIFICSFYTYSPSGVCLQLKRVTGASACLSACVVAIIWHRVLTHTHFVLTVEKQCPCRLFLKCFGYFFPKNKGVLLHGHIITMKTAVIFKGLCSSPYSVSN